jgi:hypothetical protein
MHNFIRTFQILLVVILLNVITASPLLAQEPPPPPPQHGEGGNVPGGGAPVGSGVVLLIALGAAYGVKKIFTGEKKSGINSTVE